MTFAQSYNLNPRYYVDNDADVLRLMKTTYQDTISIQQNLWQQCDIDQRFLMGDQDIWGRLYGNLLFNRRMNFQFNHIRSLVSMVTGYQRKNRRQSIIIPQEGSDQKTADQLSKVLQWESHRADEYHTISQAFEMAVTTGLGFTHTWLDFRDDPINGTIRVDAVPYQSIMLDPYFRKLDLSDCNYIWSRKYLTKDVAIQLLPGKEQEILSLNTNQYRDDKFIYILEQYNLNATNLVAYDEFWYRTTRPVTLLIDTQSGETMEWDEGSEAGLESFLQRFPTVVTKKIEKPTVKLAIVLNNDNVMYHGENPNGIDSYPYQPFVCYFYPDSPYYALKMQGMVRGLRDPQFLYNRRKQIELDMLESMATTGLKVMEGSLVDDKQAFQTGQGRAYFIKKDAKYGMQSVEAIAPPQVPQTTIELSNLLSQELQKISGINEELLGSAIDDKAGILSMLRQGAGLTTLQTMFDNLDLSQKLHTQMKLELIQKNWSPGKIKQIIGEEPTEQFYSQSFQKYHAAITNGYDTPTQKQLTAIQLKDLQQMGYPIPVEYMMETVDIQNKSKLIEQVQKQQEQQQKMQEMQMQIQMQQIQADIEDKKARAIANIGLGKERDSRVSENEALAIERRAQAVYDEIKAVKELQGMDYQHISILIEALDKIKQTQDTQEERLANKSRTV